MQALLNDNSEHLTKSGELPERDLDVWTFVRVATELTSVYVATKML